MLYYLKDSINMYDTSNMIRDSIEDASCHRLAIHANPTQSRTFYLILHIIHNSDAAKFQEPLNSTRDILHMHFKNSEL